MPRVIGARAGVGIAVGYTVGERNRAYARARPRRLRAAEYRGVVAAPKGGKTRVVPTTARLLAALKAYRHLRGPRIFYLPEGHSVSEEWVRGAIKRVEKRAGLPVTKGKCHKLRHSFCTRLAMAGQAPRTIQALAGHVSI